MRGPETETGDEPHYASDHSQGKKVSLCVRHDVGAKETRGDSWLMVSFCPLAFVFDFVSPYRFPQQQVKHTENV